MSRHLLKPMSFKFGFEVEGEEQTPESIGEPKKGGSKVIADLNPLDELRELDLQELVRPRYFHCFA